MNKLSDLQGFYLTSKGVFFIIRGGSCPSFDWWYDIIIIVRGAGIPLSFIPGLFGKEYYSHPPSAGKNNIPTSGNVAWYANSSWSSEQYISD
jgi:hypothetical protein